MRRITLLLLLLATACQDSTQKNMIAGTWQYNMDATIEALKEQGADQNTINYTQSILLSLQQARLELRPSGEAHFNMPDMKASGSWKVSNKGKAFQLQLDSIEQVSDILYLSEDTLILSSLLTENAGSLRVLTRP